MFAWTKRLSLDFLLEHRGTPTLMRFRFPPVATVLLIIPLSSLPIVSITSRLTTFAQGCECSAVFTCFPACFKTCQHMPALFECILKDLVCEYFWFLRFRDTFSISNLVYFQSIVEEFATKNHLYIYFAFLVF